MITIIIIYRRKYLQSLLRTRRPPKRVLTEHHVYWPILGYAKTPNRKHDKRYGETICYAMSWSLIKLGRQECQDSLCILNTFTFLWLLWRIAVWINLLFITLDQVATRLLNLLLEPSFRNQRLCEPTHSYYLRDEIKFLCVIAVHGLFQFCLLLLKYINVCSVMHCYELHISMLCAWIFIIVGWKWIGVVNRLHGRIR